MTKVRIDMNDKLQVYQGKNRYTDLKNEAESVRRTNKNFDQIEIRSNHYKKIEQTFCEEMEKRVKDNVKKENSMEKIENLKEQVQQNNYVFDVTELVSKILLEKGE